MNFFLRYAGLFVLIIFSQVAKSQDVTEPPSHRVPTVPRNSFSGKITDTKTSLPLQGASIYFEDVKAGASSAADGSFMIRNIPSGRHLVEISFVGYSNITTYIDVNGDVRKDFALTTAVIENNEVVVTGVSRASQIRRTPTPISVVKKADLLQSVSTNLIDALSHKPGITQISSGPAISKPVIRGLGYNRVVVINDGVRQEGQQWGDEHGIEIDEYSVSKVEILKGPASLMYGGDAMAGVVNIITNVPVPDGTFKGNIVSNYQTNNRLRGIGANMGGNNHGFNWNAYGSYKAAADYSNRYDGRVFNSKYNEHNFGGYLGYNNSWGHVHFIVSSFDQHPGIIEGIRDSSGRFVKQLAYGVSIVPDGSDFNSTNPLVPKQEVKHFKISSESAFHFGKDELALNVGYQDNQRIEYGDPAAPDERGLFFDLHTVTYSAIYHFADRHNWSTSIGVNGMLQHNQNRGTEYLIPDYNLTDIGGFAYTQKTYEKLTLSGGIRFDNRALDTKTLVEGGVLKFKAFSKDFSNVSGSAGLSYLLTDKITFKFNVARGFRSPSIPELSSNGAHEGTNRYEYGQTDLKSETSLQFDAGLEVNTEHVSFSASLFNNHIDNFIFYRKLQAAGGGDSTLVVNGAKIPAFQFDQRKANLAGLELNFDIHPHPLDWLHFENTLSLVSGKFTTALEGTKNIPFIPATHLVSELKGDFFKQGKGLKNLTARVSGDINFAQNHPFLAYNTETATPAYFLLNAGVSGDVVHKGRTLFSVYLNGLNLGNIAYQNHLSRLKYTDVNLATGRQGVYNVGRNFSLKVNIPLAFTAKTKADNNL